MQKLTAFILLVTVLITVLIYLPSFSLPLRKGVLNNSTFPLTFDLVHNIPAFICQIENPLSLGFIRPFSHLALYLDFLISGYHPFGLRLTHLLLQIGNLLGVYALGVLLFKDKRWALVAASLFAFHPNALEAVISTLPQDLLACFFYLWGLWAWGRFLLADKRRAGWLTLTLLALLCGVLSKELLLTFPVLALLLHISFFGEKRLERFNFKSNWWAYGLQILLLGLYWIYRLSVLGGVGGYMGAKHFSLTIDILPNIIRVIDGAFFIEKQLCALQLTHPLWIAGTIIGIVITAIGLRPRQRGHRGWTTAFAFAFMFISAAATLNFRWLGWWYIYLPLAGVSLGVAGLLREIAARTRKPRSVFAAGLLLALILVPVTMQRVDDMEEGLLPKLTMYHQISKIFAAGPSGDQLYIWRQRTNALMRFNIYQTPHLDRETQAQWAANRLKIIHMTDGPDHSILVGYNMIPPYQPVFTPDNRFYRLEYRGKQPTIKPLSPETLREEIAEAAKLEKGRKGRRIY